MLFFIALFVLHLLSLQFSRVSKFLGLELCSTFFSHIVSRRVENFAPLIMAFEDQKGCWPKVRILIHVLLK